MSSKPEKNTDIINTVQAAAYIGYSPWTVRQLVAKEQIPYIRMPSGVLKFRRSALERWLNAPRPRRLRKAG